MAAEGACSVNAELLSEADPGEALDDVKARVDAIDTFPEETEEPVVEQVTMRRGAIDLALSGDLPERALKQIASRVRDELASLPELTQVELAGARAYEISDRGLRGGAAPLRPALRRRRRRRAALVPRPAGRLHQDRRRRGAAAHQGPGLPRGPSSSRSSCARAPTARASCCGDVATVVDGFEDNDRSLAFDGDAGGHGPRLPRRRPGRARDRGGGRAATSTRRARGCPRASRSPSGATARSRCGTASTPCSRNGRTGFILVFVVLALFLRLRLAFWVALGVPIAFCGAIWALPIFDISINVISLFAFILVLGILVDDAIVVGENIYTHQQQPGDAPGRGRSTARREVAVPVIFGVLTTVAAFLPLILARGHHRADLRRHRHRRDPVPGVLADRVAADPAGAPRPRQSHANAEARTAAGSRWTRFQDRFAVGLERLIEGPYRRGARPAREWRYLTVSPRRDGPRLRSRRGGERAAAVLLLPVDRGRLRHRLADHGAGHSRRRHGRRRGEHHRCRPAAGPRPRGRAPGRRSAHAEARAGGGRRAADPGLEQRPGQRGARTPVGCPHGRGHHRAGSRRAAQALDGARSPNAGASGSSRSRAPRSCSS